MTGPEVEDVFLLPHRTTTEFPMPITVSGQYAAVDKVLESGGITGGDLLIPFIGENEAGALTRLANHRGVDQTGMKAGSVSIKIGFTALCRPEGDRTVQRFRPLLDSEEIQDGHKVQARGGGLNQSAGGR